MAALKHADRIVVKIGSALLVDGLSGRLKVEWLQSLAADIAAFHQQGRQVILVSSGSIALGRGVLEMTGKNLPLEQSQAAAAVGQIRLARAYEEVLAPLGAITAQVLVTLEDSAVRRRYLNTRATLETLLGLGVIPIVNENDTVATDEIRFGDNDRLAAQIAVTVGADHLVLLSDVDGFYSGNPRTDPTAKRFDIIDEITSEIESMADDAGSGLSKGGMKTKLMAAKTATKAGCDMTITQGETMSPLRKLLDGAASTVFTARVDPKTARKAWIASMKPQGVLTLDQGAVAALDAGKSLLSAGVIKVSGHFSRGDPVEIYGPDGTHLGSGLTNYNAEDSRAIMGKKTDRIEEILGHSGRAALIHRNDMSL